MLIPYSQLIKRYNILPKGVIHIGANTGQEAPDYYSNGVERTIWVEANPSLIFELLANLQPYPEHLIFNDCVSDVDGEDVVLHISNNGGQSSSILELEYHKIAHPEVHYIQDIQMKSTRLDSLIERNEIDITQYPFMNVDIQGAELLALKGMGQYLSHIQYLYIEVNEQYLYKDCALLTELSQYLEQYGLYMVEKKMAGSFGWGDAFYIRK